MPITDCCRCFTSAYIDLQSSGFKMIVTDDLDDAAVKAVNVANIVKQAEDVSLSVQFS